MREYRMSETKLREQQALASESAQPRPSSNHLIWKIVGGVVLAVAATTLITSLNDIRRYIRITRM